MELQVISFNHNNKELLKKALSIREKVFVHEQGVDKSLEYSGDPEATHYLIQDKELPVCTARWRITNTGIKLERFAVIPEYRNKGVGKIILTRILNDVSSMKKLIYLHAQEGAVNFYLQNGFQTEGEMFFEANIKHYKMILK